MPALINNCARSAIAKNDSVERGDLDHTSVSCWRAAAARLARARVCAAIKIIGGSAIHKLPADYPISSPNL
jgi:hypothetical protein